MLPTHSQVGAPHTEPRLSWALAEFSVHCIFFLQWLQSLRQFSFSRENCLLRNIAYSVLPLYAVFCLLHIAHCCLTNPLLLVVYWFGQSLNPMEMPRDGRVAAELKSLGGRCEQLPWKQRTLAGPAACLWTKGGAVINVWTWSSATLPFTCNRRNLKELSCAIMTRRCWRWWPTHSCRQPPWQGAAHSLAAELHLLHNLLLLHHTLVAQNKPLCVCKILYQGALPRTEQAKSVAILAKVPYLPSRESVICLKMSTKHVRFFYECLV